MKMMMMTTWIFILLSKFGSKKRIKIIQGLPCLICLSLPSQNVHVKSRGAGGNKDDIVNLCYLHHSMLHNIGIKTFETKYSIDLTEEARKLKEFLECI